MMLSRKSHKHSLIQKRVLRFRSLQASNKKTAPPRASLPEYSSPRCCSCEPVDTRLFLSLRSRRWTERALQRLSIPVASTWFVRPCLFPGASRRIPTGPSVGWSKRAPALQAGRTQDRTHIIPKLSNRNYDHNHSTSKKTHTPVTKSWIPAV